MVAGSVPAAASVSVGALVMPDWQAVQGVLASMNRGNAERSFTVRQDLHFQYRMVMIAPRFPYCLRQPLSARC
jgi:hypothetical protein